MLDADIVRELVEAGRMPLSPAARPELPESWEDEAQEDNDEHYLPACGV